MANRQADSASSSSARAGAHTVIATTQAISAVLSNMQWLSGTGAKRKISALGKDEVVTQTTNSLRKSGEQGQVVGTAESILPDTRKPKTLAKNTSETKSPKKLSQLVKEYRETIRRIGKKDGPNPLPEEQRLRLANRAREILAEVGPITMAHYMGGKAVIETLQKPEPERTPPVDVRQGTTQPQAAEKAVKTQPTTSTHPQNQNEQKPINSKKKPDSIIEATKQLLGEEASIKRPVSTTPLEPVSTGEVETQQDTETSQSAQTAETFNDAAEDKAPVPQTSIIYRAEEFNISRQANTVTITDKFSDVTLFKYTQDGNQTRVITDLITNDPEKFKVFSQAHANIKEHTIGAILSDPRGINQVNNLQGLAPEGSHAIALAHTYLDAEGSQTAKPQLENGQEKYEFEKTREGYRISHLHTTNNGELEKIPAREQIVITSKGNNILIDKEGGLTEKEARLFKAHYHHLTERLELQKQEQATKQAEADESAKAPVLKRDREGR